MKLALENLRQKIEFLEGAPQRLSRAIPVSNAIDSWLPQRGLPGGCIHEIKGTSLASAIAFSAVLSARLAAAKGHILYIAPDRSLHPLGLLPYGVKLPQMLHVSARKSQDQTWAVMEALRCSQVSAVMAVLSGLDQIESRRLQLAAETSGATAFLLGLTNSPPIASPITRWKVSPVVSKAKPNFDEPMWDLELLYCRGGRPGKWLIEWSGRKLSAIPAQPTKQTYEALAG